MFCLLQEIQIKFCSFLRLLLHAQAHTDSKCTTSMHFSLFPTQEAGSACPKNLEIHVCLNSLLVDEYNII